MLDKTIRINLLYDFYHELLTEKQQTFLLYYYQDNYSLGEIAEQFEISRQAVNEHIKRAEFMLEEYETKLQLLRKHTARRELHNELRKAAEAMPREEKHTVINLLDRIDRIDD